MLNTAKRIARKVKDALNGPVDPFEEMIGDTEVAAMLRTLVDLHCHGQWQGLGVLIRKIAAKGLMGEHDSVRIASALQAAIEQARGRLQPDGPANDEWIVNLTAAIALLKVPRDPNVDNPKGVEWETVK